MFSIAFANRSARSLQIACVGFSLLAAAGVTSVGAHETIDLGNVREATMDYQNVGEAEEAGYALLADKDGITCIDNPDEGTMGIPTSMAT
jgi:hypothetical protein